MATITVTGTRITDETPPRCRKPRPVQHEETVTVEIPDIAAAAMTPAFWVRSGATRFFDHSTTVDMHGDKLYRPLMLSEKYAICDAADETVLRLGDEMFGTEQRDGLYARCADSAEDYASQVSADFEKYIVVDGQTWVETAEPCWYVTTFGLGGNHGGTALMTNFGIPHGVRPDLIFRADDFDSAKAAAERIAYRRGDTESMSRLGDRRHDLRVLDPEAVTRVTIPAESDEARNAHNEYRLAVSALKDATTIDAEAEAFEHVQRTRQAVLDLGAPVIEPNSTPYEGRTLRSDVQV
jgi:hypothetical protein